MSVEFVDCSKVVCSCGDVVREIDTLFCHKCGDVVCVDCLSEGYMGEIYCTYCEGYGMDTPPKEEIELMNLIIDGKKYEITPSRDLAFCSSYTNGFSYKSYLNIKGIGMLKYLYRSITPIYNNEMENTGDVYTLYFEKVR